MGKYNKISDSFLVEGTIEQKFKYNFLSKMWSVNEVLTLIRYNYSLVWTFRNYYWTQQMSFEAMPFLTWRCYGRDCDGRLGTRSGNILMTSNRNLCNNQLITSSTPWLAVEPDWHRKWKLMHWNVQRWRLCGLWKCWNSWQGSQRGLERWYIPPHRRGEDLTRCVGWNRQRGKGYALFSDSVGQSWW
jgi:hypothetical protein